MLKIASHWSSNTGCWLDLLFSQLESGSKLSSLSAKLHLPNMKLCSPVCNKSLWIHADFILLIWQQTVLIMPTPCKKRILGFDIWRKSESYQIKCKRRISSKDCCRARCGKTRIASIVKIAQSSREEVLQQWEDSVASGQKILKAHWP